MTQSDSDIAADAGAKVDEAEDLFAQIEGVDWFLAWTIGFADTFHMEQGITLNVGGTLISGTLISGREYFEETAAKMAGANVHFRGEREPRAAGNSIAETLATSIRTFKELYPVPDGTTKVAERKPAYIHLRDARVLTPDGRATPMQFELWRGKLTSVDGFCSGELVFT